MLNRVFKFFVRNYLDYFFIFLIAFFVFFYLQSTATLPDPDSFYHAKIADLIKKQGIITSFPWAQFSTLKDNYIDHHFLYHLYLIPFTLFFKPLIAIKMATIFLDIILVLFFYFFLTHFKIKWRFLWVLILLTINPFLFRISLAKAPALSIIFLLLGFYALVNYRRWLLFFLSFFYIWAYGGWPLLWLLSFIYFAIDIIYDKFKKQSLFWQTIKLIISPIHPLKKKKKRKDLFLALFFGTVAGLIINPYFPKNIYFYYQQVYQIAVINLQKIIGVGGEWYPYGLSSLIKDTGILFPILIIALFIFIISFKKQSRVSIILFFVALFFFLYTLKSRRSVEYFVPFSLLFASFSVDGFLKSILVKTQINLGLWLSPSLKRLLNVFIIALLLIIIWFGATDLKIVRKDMERGISLIYYQGAGNWLSQNTPKGSIVLHSDWDDFPILFYFSDNNYYINGLDQTFMYNFDKNLFWQWINITTGKSPDNLIKVIKNDFRASYIFIESDHLAMDNLFKNNNFFKLIYQDNEAKIYQVK